MGTGAAHKQEEVQTGLLGAWQACLTLPYRKWARSAQNRGGSPTSVRSWLEAAAMTGQRGRKGQAKLSHEAAPPDPPRTKWIQTQKIPRFLWPGRQVHIPGRLSGRSSLQATMPQPQAEFQAVDWRWPWAGIRVWCEEWLKAKPPCFLGCHLASSSSRPGMAKIWGTWPLLLSQPGGWDGMEGASIWFWRTSTSDPHFLSGSSSQHTLQELELATLSGADSGDEMGMESRDGWEVKVRWATLTPLYGPLFCGISTSELG